MKTQLIRNKLSNFTSFLKLPIIEIQKFVKTGTGKNIGFPEHCAMDRSIVLKPDASTYFFASSKQWKYKHWHFFFMVNPIISTVLLGQ